MYQTNSFLLAFGGFLIELQSPQLTNRRISRNLFHWNQFLVILHLNFKNVYFISAKEMHFPQADCITLYFIIPRTGASTQLT